MTSVNRQQEIEARVERLMTMQPTAPPDARRVRRAFPVVGQRRESTRHLALEIEVDEEFASSLRRPGQYVTLKVSGWPARFFVVASQTGRCTWEFLIDQRGELGSVLENFKVDQTICVSLPEGGGFDPEEAAGEVAVLFCTGSGIATMRPLIEYWLEKSEIRPSQIGLYYGESQADAFAYPELLKAWSSKGIAVHRAVEQSGESMVARYVQEAFDAAPLPLEKAHVYLSGAPVMVQLVAEKVLRQGVAPSRVQTNI